MNSGLAFPSRCLGSPRTGRGGHVWVGRGLLQGGGGGVLLQGEGGALRLWIGLPVLLRFSADTSLRAPGSLPRLLKPQLC